MKRLVLILPILFLVALVAEFSARCQTVTPAPSKAFDKLKADIAQEQQVWKDVASGKQTQQDAMPQIEILEHKVWEDGYRVMRLNHWDPKTVEFNPNGTFTRKP